MTPASAANASPYSLGLISAHQLAGGAETKEILTTDLMDLNPYFQGSCKHAAGAGEALPATT